MKISRECQSCAECCNGWVKITVENYEASPGNPCPYSTGNGCANYENRPVDPCRNFMCGWVQSNSPLPDWMKPNEANVIVIFEKFRYQGVPVDLAVPTGRKIPQRSIEWLKKNAEQSGRPLIFFENTKQNKKYTGDSLLFVHGPVEFQTYVNQRMEEGKTVW